MGQPVPFRRRFSHLSIGLPLSILSGLFAEITSPPPAAAQSQSSPLPSHIFPDVIAIVTLFVERERPKRSNSVVRHSTFAPQMQQADRPTDRDGAAVHFAAMHSLTLRLHSFWRGIFHLEGYYWSAKGRAQIFQKRNRVYFLVTLCVFVSFPCYNDNFDKSWAKSSHPECFLRATKPCHLPLYDNP